MVAGDELNVLLADYQEARNDERSYDAVVAAILAIAVPLVGGLATLLLARCAPGSQGCTPTPNWILALLPAVPVVLLMYFSHIATLGAMRSFYLRAIERELRRSAGYDLQLDATKTLRGASYFDLVHPLLSQRRGSMPHRLVWPVLYTALAAVGIGTTVVSIAQIDGNPLLSVSASVVYAAAGLLIGAIGWSAGAGGRRLFTRLADEASGTIGLPLTRQPTDWSLLRYVALPRPSNIFKSLFGVLVFVLFVLAGGGARFDNSAAAIVLIVCFELIVYQARYVRNDLRDRLVDSGHPFAVQRSRIPASLPPGDLSVIKMSIIARFFLAAVVAFQFASEGFGSHSIVFALMCVSAWLVAVVYDAVKDRVRRSSTGLDSPGHLFLFWLSGLGYGIRAVGAGLLAGSASGDVLSYTLAGVWAVSLGVLLVTMTWVIDASTMTSSDGMTYSSELVEQSHRRSLLGQADLLKPGALAVPGYVGMTTRIPLLYGGRYLTTWNFAAAVSFITAVPFGLVLAGVTLPAAVSNPATLGLPVSLVMIVAAIIFRAKASMILSLALASVIAVVVVAAAAVLGGSRPWLAFGPVLLSITTYASFRGLTFEAAIGAVSRIYKAIGRAGRPLRWVIYG